MEECKSMRVWVNKCVANMEIKKPTKTATYIHGDKEDRHVCVQASEQACRNQKQSKQTKMSHRLNQ